MSKVRGMKRIIDRIYRHESLDGIDLRNLYLSSMNFSRLGLRRADLTGCCLNHALLDGCDLTNANLTGAKLSHASLKRARLSGAIFADVLVDGASFKGATGLEPSTKEYLKAKGAKDVD
ncbi:MAG TPA: pentapeptide repeat-containing protein [Candidatus Binatia bacterium]|nr:pentapeptide repeat-containing protein [Candidatus Binatia bacterium]